MSYFCAALEGAQIVLNSGQCPRACTRAMQLRGCAKRAKKTAKADECILRGTLGHYFFTITYPISRLVNCRLEYEQIRKRFSIFLFYALAVLMDFSSEDYLLAEPVCAAHARWKVRFHKRKRSIDRGRSPQSSDILY